jgi:membrane protein implicated in regulation of membrane protease activity
VSPTGAFILAISAIAMLGAVALWLLNVPLWSVPVFFLLVAIIARALFRRRSTRQEDRQKTEA